MNWYLKKALIHNFEEIWIEFAIDFIETGEIMFG